MTAGVSLTHVDRGGAADRAGLRAGDRLLAINGHEVADQIDVRFYSSALRLRLEWGREGQTYAKTVRLRPGESLGWELEPFTPRRCANRCPFCFVLQLPPGLRQPLYFRDEDFRLSFLYGHYITGTNLSDGDLERIVRQRLSPLYLSVHATDPELRARMLGRKHVKPIAALLNFLRANEIDFHAQVVVCPDWNDGPALVKTLDDLKEYVPTLRSIALVPVGLTAHREGLPRIRPITPRYAARMIDHIEPIARHWRREPRERILFLADEWYLRAKRPVPTYRGLDVAPQFENGVGMVSRFLRSWPATERQLPERVGRTPGSRTRSVAIVTGMLAAPVLRPLVMRLNAIQGLRVDLVAVRNRLFGPTVTVSGLLAGRDILASLLQRRRADLYLVPENCLRPWDHVFLDDFTLPELSARLDRPVVPVEDTSRGLVKAIVETKHDPIPLAAFPDPS
jgi:putative radical SAM enzyme (TIGR03279 family)